VGWRFAQHALLPESTWYSLLDQFLRYPTRDQQGPELATLFGRALEIMAERPHEKAWTALEGFLLQNVDHLSGWSTSWIREDAERKRIFRSDDGNYYLYDSQGTLIQIIGQTTFSETRLDFLSDSILRPYGLIRQILSVYSLFAISETFAGLPDTYPSSLRLLIGEPTFGMLSPSWHWMRYFKVRTVRWRPDDNHCDPEWLAMTLLARLTDTLDRDLWREHIEAYKERINQLEEDCQHQLDYVVDAHLQIGDQDEVYFEFEGRRFRWINGTPESSPIISVGYKHMNDHREEDEALNRLMSVLVWEHRMPIVKKSGVGGRRRPLPLTWGPRMSGGLKVDPNYLFRDHHIPASEKEWLALALYKEGVNSASVFYRYLSFWKILEVAIAEKGERWDWINSAASTLALERARVQEILTSSPDIAEYLDYSGRCAIAHVFKPPIIDPDDYDDNLRITKDVRVVEELARMAVATVLRKAKSDAANSKQQG